tara:strand:+ start:739 stop:1182 length:444 start_codon:yes stop_codon:yes gene_type:complete
MATKLNVDDGGLAIGKKLWKTHQDNEYTRVDNYKEAICLNCFKKDAAAATIADICGDCAGKRGRESLLVKITDKMYGLCFFCGKHKFGIEQINARFCRSCHRRIANVTKEYNKKGGMFNVDPFWLAMKKKFGKDWKVLMSNPTSIRK